MTVPKGQTFAFVTFDTTDSADKCVAELAEVAGAKVEVRIVRRERDALKMSLQHMRAKIRSQAYLVREDAYF